MNKSFAVALIAASTLLLTGCPAGLGGSDYSRSQARTVQEVQTGIVESVREVTIEGTKTPIGAGAGAVVGGVGGAAAEEAVTRQKGVEITVKLDSGRMIAITQATDQEFRVGDRVRVLSGGGVTRVTQ